MDRGLLARCETENLHLSGTIQPHGTLLVVAADGRVSHVAGNVGAFLGGDVASWSGQLLPRHLASPIADLGSKPGTRLVCAGGIEGVTGLLDMVASRGARGEIVLELMPHVAQPEWRRSAGEPLLAPPADADALEAERRRLVERVAALTGFERVMFYVFREEGDGDVVAEVCQSEKYGSYLGLRFPASDIPRIAREMYLKNPWRMIPDAAAEPVAVFGADGDLPDLTWSDLRSVSPVHRVYLANMGVAASVSFPVVAHGELAALVAAHCRAPCYLPVAVLEQASALVRDHGFAFAGYQSQRRMRLIDGMQYRFEAIREMLRRHGSLRSCWPELADWLMREFRADGVVFCASGECLFAGVGLEQAALEVLDAWFRETHGEFVWSGDSLARQVPAFPLSEVAGVMALRIGGGRDGRGLRLYLTRTEHVLEIAWGGNPEKPVEYHDGTLGIAPRHSFERWVEKRLGHCRPWDNEARLLALKLRDLLYRASPPT